MYFITLILGKRCKECTKRFWLRGRPAPSLCSSCSERAEADRQQVAFWQAVEEGNVVELTRSLEAGMDVNAIGTCGETAVYVAAARGHSDAVALLCTRGARTNVRARERIEGIATFIHGATTPLFEATRNRRMSTVATLLAHGADPNLSDACHRSTALQSAALQGEIELVRILLQAGAEVNAQDRSGTTALHNAASRDHTEVIKILLAAGADPFLADRAGHTVAAFAARSESKEVRALLLKDVRPSSIAYQDGDRVRIKKDGSAIAEPLATSHSEPVILEERGRLGTIVNIRGGVLVVKWDAGKYRVYAGSDDRTTYYKGTIHLKAFSSGIHPDHVEPASLPIGDCDDNHVHVLRVDPSKFDCPRCLSSAIGHTRASEQYAGELWICTECGFKTDRPSGI